MRFGFAIFVALLSSLVWRARYLWKNSILLRSDFPIGWFHKGDFDSQCTVIKEEDFKFCEDATFWEVFDAKGNVERRVIASCDPGRHEWNTVMGPLQNPDPLGSLWMYVPGGKKDKPQRIVFQNYPAGHDFHPLGVEVYPSYAGNTSNMFVINHARSRSFVEQFTISPSESVARYVRTISSRHFNAPNALALTSPNSFYITNDHFFTRRLPYVGHVLPLIESVFGLPFGWVSHITLNANPDAPSAIESESLSTAFIPFANGISISPEGTEVAVAACSFNSIFFYNRDPATNTLSLQHKVPVPFSPDNVVYNEDGSLVVAGHPNFPDVTKLSQRKAPTAPSWIVSIKPASKVWSNNTVLPASWDSDAPISASSKVPAVLTHEMETIFQSNGTGFSASTTGLIDSKKGLFYAPGLYTEGMLVCRS